LAKSTARKKKIRFITKSRIRFDQTSSSRKEEKKLREKESTLCRVVVGRLLKGCQEQKRVLEKVGRW